MQIVECEIAKVCAPRCDEILFFRRENEQRVAVQVTQMSDALPQSPRRARKHGITEYTRTFSTDEKAERSCSTELAPRYGRARYIFGTVGFFDQSRTEMFEINETVEQYPRTKMIRFANESPFSGQSTPHGGDAV